MLSASVSVFLVLWQFSLFDSRLLYLSCLCLFLYPLYLSSLFPCLPTSTVTTTLRAVAIYICFRLSTIIPSVVFFPALPVLSVSLRCPPSPTPSPFTLPAVAVYICFRMSTITAPSVVFFPALPVLVSRLYLSCPLRFSTLPLHPQPPFYLP